MGVIAPKPKPGATAPAAAPAPAASDKPVLLAITSCPTGIAHTYMAASPT